MGRFALMLPLGMLALSLAACALPQAGGGAGLEKEVSSLTRSQQDLTREVEGLRAELRDAQGRLESHQMVIDDLQRVLSAAAPAGRAPLSPSFPSAAQPPAAEGKSSPTEVYQKAFADYASGRYPQAVQGFESFIRLFPDSGFAGNAQYWLGESYFSQQEYGRAIAAFQKVVERHPQGGKAPDALYKMALAHQKINQADRAREALRMLKERYPESSAAQKSLDAPGL